MNSITLLVGKQVIFFLSIHTQGTTSITHYSAINDEKKLIQPREIPKAGDMDFPILLVLVS